MQKGRRGGNPSAARFLLVSPVGPAGALTPPTSSRLSAGGGNG